MKKPAQPLTFNDLRSTRPRREPARVIVLHWTGGLRPPRGVFKTLRATKGPKTPDGLSVHFVVGHDGEVLQFADLKRVCLHAGIANNFSVGIEVQSPGYPGEDRDEEAGRGVSRDDYDCQIRNRRITVLDYTVKQTAAVALLCERLCPELSIPRAVPLAADGSLLTRTMTASELATFAGVMGHFHCDEQKNDPGVRPLERLRVRWGGRT